MPNLFVARLSLFSSIAIAFMAINLSAPSVRAQNKVYNPLSLPPSGEVADTLSEKDIPTGDGTFARDYVIKLNAGDQVAIDLTSESFDTIVRLMTTDGTSVGENDDGPDGSTNSLLFARIKNSGQYIIRVRGFGEAAGGQFKLKVTRLRPVSLRSVENFI